MEDVEASVTKQLMSDWGIQVREARTSQGLTPRQVADQLNLRESFVDALEGGRGDEHMDRAYARIHLRSIATLLGIELRDWPYA